MKTTGNNSGSGGYNQSSGGYNPPARGRGRGRGGGQTGRSNPPPHMYCFDFNTNKGCPNAHAGGFCDKNNQKFEHRCLNVMPGNCSNKLSFSY